MGQICRIMSRTPQGERRAHRSGRMHWISATPSRMSGTGRVRLAPHPEKLGGVANHDLQTPDRLNPHWPGLCAETPSSGASALGGVSTPLFSYIGGRPPESLSEPSPSVGTPARCADLGHVKAHKLAHAIQETHFHQPALRDAVTLATPPGRVVAGLASGPSQGEHERTPFLTRHAKTS